MKQLASRCSRATAKQNMRGCEARSEADIFTTLLELCKQDLEHQLGQRAQIWRITLRNRMQAVLERALIVILYRRTSSAKKLQTR
eukprot:Skav230020  [mRNA]  locus=scaffold769:293047:293550:- [translate_table: standard]